MVMKKKERKFTWCVRRYNVKTGDVKYYMHSGWTTREINEFVSDFVASYKGYIIHLFKSYKKF
jgi:hypothetical protein